MTKTLINAYRAEYELGSISIQELCDKHNISIEDLGDTSDWSSPTIISAPSTLEDNPSSPATEDLEDNPSSQTSQDSTSSQTLEPIVLVQEPTLTKASLVKYKPEETQLVPAEMEKISSFKSRAIDYALELLEEPHLLTTKDFKSLVDVVDSIEKSYVKAPASQGPTINIAIQNLVSRFNDDC